MSRRRKETLQPLSRRLRSVLMDKVPQIERKHETGEYVATVIDSQARLKHLGRELRLEYDAVAHEPVPDAMITLLRKFDRQHA